jgi:thiosulfate dehydrogenase (quinone) large subunit
VVRPWLGWEWLQAGWSKVFAGTAGVNPAMIVVSLFVILAWRNAGWYGLDRFVLPRLGTPWHPGRGGDKDSRLMTT